MTHANDPAATPHHEGAPGAHHGAERAALTIHTIADIAAGILGLWILMYLLGANQANGLVSFVHGSASWLAGWSQDLFTMDSETLRVLLNFGTPAVLYLLIGHGLAARIRTF
ncbi:hypothetical protein [Streptomyces sp. 8N706]|uniref:hypothetical protein n=1 Tax=Streptomyces sp. 8N706 TaxID=3457416 RepID=UPI003FD02D3D